MPGCRSGGSGDVSTYDYCYRPVTSKCTTVPAGKWKSGNTCVLCPTGRYGQYSGRTSYTQCAQCQKGRYGPSSGHTRYNQCPQCPAGRYGRYAGRTSSGQCPSCPRGKTSTAGRTASSQCTSTSTSCAAGKYKRGNTCYSCPSGRYGQYSGRTTYTQCAQCPKGRYGRYAGRTSYAQCPACPRGKTSTAGRTASSQCTGGSSRRSGSSSPPSTPANKGVCPVGKHGGNACADCPAGKTTTGAPLLLRGSAWKKVAGSFNCKKFVNSATVGKAAYNMPGSLAK